MVRRPKGDTLLLLLNAHWEEIPFTLPEYCREGMSGKP